jgi:hypothetical protein
MTRDQAQPGTQVTWTRPDGTRQTGTVLAAPLDQSENVLVTWWDHTQRQRQNQLVPISRLRVVPEVGR